MERKRWVSPPLNPTSYEATIDIPALRRELTGVVFIVAGQRNSKGSDRYNRSLSESRAQSVRDYLVSHGVTSERLIVKGYGEDHPIDSNDTEDGRSNNRRSEFIHL
ncbi:MAG: OmpA family protein [Methylococcales bacterium]